MISISGRMAFAATAMPEISPPPPIGHDDLVEIGHLLEHLEPIVPWPAITFGSS